MAHDVESLYSIYILPFGERTGKKTTCIATLCGVSLLRSTSQLLNSRLISIKILSYEIQKDFENSYCYLEKKKISA
jgi:hypothetical protein